MCLQQRRAQSKLVVPESTTVTKHLEAMSPRPGDLSLFMSCGGQSMDPKGSCYGASAAGPQGSLHSDEVMGATALGRVQVV